HTTRSPQERHGLFPCAGVAEQAIVAASAPGPFLFDSVRRFRSFLANPHFLKRGTALTCSGLGKRMQTARRRRAAIGLVPGCDLRPAHHPTLAWRWGTVRHRWS